MSGWGTVDQILGTAGAPDWSALRSGLRVTFTIIHPANWEPGSFTMRGLPKGSGTEFPPLRMEGVPLDAVSDAASFDTVMSGAVANMRHLVTSSWALQTDCFGHNELSGFTPPVHQMVGPFSPDELADLARFAREATELLVLRLEKDYLFGVATRMWTGRHPAELGRVYQDLWLHKDGLDAAALEESAVKLVILYLERARRAESENDPKLAAECSRVAALVCEENGLAPLAALVRAEFSAHASEWQKLDARRAAFIQGVDYVFSEGFAEWQSYAGLRLIENGLLKPLYRAVSTDEARRHMAEHRARIGALSASNPYRLGTEWLEAIQLRIGDCLIGTGLLASLVAWPLSCLSRHLPVRALEAIAPDSLWLPDRRAMTLAQARFDDLGPDEGRRVEGVLTGIHGLLDSPLAGFHAASREWVVNASG